MDTSPAILIFTRPGLRTAQTVQSKLGGNIHGFGPRVSESDILFDEAAEHIQSLFMSGRPIIGICSVGILIRSLADLVSNKKIEPPVLAVSEDGKSVVPLLGGHNGGNRIAFEVAECTGGQAFVTTASDVSLGVSLEEPPKGWVFANPENFKSFVARMLSSEPISIKGEINWLPREKLNISDSAKLSIVATEKSTKGNSETLIFHPKTLSIGVGCIRGCEYDELRNLVFESLQRSGLSEFSVSCIASIDLKADEQAICRLATELNVPFRLFSAKRLEQETPRLENPSETVFKEVGCHGVSESAALAATANQGELVVSKRKSANATCAIGLSKNPIDPESVGRSRGRLAIVGIGPGQDDWRTPEATGIIKSSSEIVGYGLYLGFIKKLISGKKCHEFPLGREIDRVRFALELAAQGKNVALISSGDAGIYAMGSLVYEILDTPTDSGGVSDAARRVEIINVPGISAFQAASARVGAPFGHDFCVISLSDLLTPWDLIERRLEAAAMGDFVIALYNPVSSRRRAQLVRAKEILLKYRSEDTPVVIAFNLGRSGENIRITTLEKLTVNDVNMLSLLVVGSSNTRSLDANENTKWLFTPRGYENKKRESNE